MSYYTYTDRQRQLLQELIGQACRCGSTKAMRQTFCKHCYYSLPVPLRNALYLPLTGGYERAYDEAAAFLIRRAKERSGEIPKGRRRAT
jgi:hypothetical protein